MLVFYQLCRYNQIPLDENKLVETIQMVLNVKNVHSSLNVISEANSFLDDGTPVLEKIGFSQLTDHNINFILRSKLKSLHASYPPSIVSDVEAICKNLIPTLTGSNDEIVKTAIKIAKKRCGIC